MEPEPVASVAGDWSLSAFFIVMTAGWTIWLFRAWRTEEPLEPMTQFEILLGGRVGRNMRRSAVGIGVLSFGVSLTMVITALDHAGELSAHMMDVLSLVAGTCVLVSFVLIAVLAMYAWPRSLVTPALRTRGQHQQQVPDAEG